MPPPGGGKRKRGDRTYSDDQQYSRPSPHRPGSLNLAQQGNFHSPSNERDYTQSRGRGGRRSSRGGRGGASASSPVNNTDESAATTVKAPSADKELSSMNGIMSTTQAPTPSVATLTSPPAETQPYSYTYFTVEVCDSWQTGGMEDVLRQGLAALQEHDTAKSSAIMQELCHSVIYGRLDPFDAGKLVKTMIETEAPAKGAQAASRPTPLQTVLLDSISIIFEATSNLPTDRLSAFLLTAEIPYELLRLELDAPLLEKLDLIRNTFSRMNIRKQTNLLYRQANFNLMREESEGFAKLMTELFTTSGNEPPTAEIVEETVEKVKAMIGAFDLDVGRSLDVVLDVFGAVLVKQFRFFVKFLRASPWWPRPALHSKNNPSLAGLPLWALPGSSDWHLTEEQKDMVAAQTQARDEDFWPQAREKGLQAFHLLGRTGVTQEQMISASAASGDDLLAQWIRETGIVPPPGNRDAAQLLGFKLRFYSSSPARDETDVLPDNLIYLSALLIKIGFISLKDLYPHIWRSDEEMEELKQQKTKEKAERERAARPGAGAKNALLMAGALADDTAPVPARLKDSTTRASTPSREADTEKVAPRDANEPADQKVLLLKSLLAIGAFPEALFILGRFPWLMDLFPDLPEYVHRILHHCLGKVYGDIQPLRDRHTLRARNPSYETDVPGFQKGQVKIVDTPERKLLRWALLDRNDSVDGTDYRFYWDEWNDNIPVCQSVDDVFTLCETLLPLVGVKIGHDPGLLLKIARIGKHSLQADRSERNRSRWLDLSKRILLPSLSLTKSNAGVVNEVFELISNFPVSVRYLMYLEWLSGRTSRNPDIKAAFDQARAETKDILKRISNTNVRPMARALAKIAFANPHIVITTALTQIEVYDSIAEVFVEGARYFTDLGYDVLTWAIVSSMAKAGRSRTQEGGMFTSRWLSALAHFAGKIYKRYGMMRPGPILQYVVEQLEHGNTTDLKMLEQIVLAMGGIATDTNYNDAQLQAMGGGPLLQSQTILQLLDRRHDSKKTSERLVKSLQDTGLAAKFLISMAQQRQVCVFEEGDVPLKAIGNTYDEVHRVMIQYLDLLRTNLSAEDFRSTIPDVVSLLVDYEIRPEIAFWISRPTISKQIVEFDRENAKDQRADDIGEKAVGGDVEMSDHINGGSEEDGEAVETDIAAGGPSSEVDFNGPSLDPDSSCKTPGPSDTPAENCWHPVMRDVMTAIQPSLPEEVVEQIGTGFYATFWQLSLYDITIPGKSYEDELSRQHKKIAAISADRSDVSVSGTKKKELAKKEIADLIDKLLAENKQHLKAFAESKARLQREKDQWFLGMARRDKDLNTALIEHCFLPRLLSSPLDAYFCFKFVKFLHGAGTPNFRTLGFYDLIFKTPRLVSLVFTCTSKEADNLGRFLNEVLKDLSRWHSAKTTYEREAWGSKKNLPGFAMKVESGKVVSLLDFESFRRVLYKWHGSLYAALQRCLGSPEYMHVRNAISVLRAISAVYPVINVHGTGLQKAVDKLRDSDKEDLKVSSQALLGALHRREKVWIDPQAFRQGSDKVGEQGQASSQSKTEASRNASDTPIKNGEDGEVKDTVMTDASTKEDDMPLGGKKDTQVGGATSAPSAEASRPASRPASRLAAPNGSSTPTRPGPDTNSTAKQDGRPIRPEAGRPQSLPRRVSPPPSRPLPATLPSRPDLPDLRTGSRESPRTSSRLQNDPHRPSPDPRVSHSRDARSGYRGPEPPVEAFDRHARRYERPDGPPQMGREERGYSRESERSKPYDRPLPPERERPPTRLPPVSDRGRDGRDRESTPRSRPAIPSEPGTSSTQAPPRKEADQATPKEGSATPSSQPAINPARAALIEGGSDQRSASATRGPGADRSSRSSRPTSPRREEDRRPHSRRDGDERPPPNHRSEPPSTRPPPHSSSATEPSFGPSSRSSGHAGFKRDSRQAPPIDMQHGRLEREHQPQRSASSRGPEQQQDSDVPSGPRSRAAPGGPPPMRAPPLNTQNLPSSGNERPTPTGPSRRHGRTSSYNEQASSPGTSSDPAGIHPSRLNQIESATPETPKSTLPPQSPQQSHPPSGPRGNAPPGAPSGPSPASRGPPSGPHGSDLGGRSGRNNRHPLTAVNNTLAQAGTSIRGRGMRQGGESFGMPSGMAPPPPPPPPAGPPANHNSSSNGFFPQKDLFPTQNPNDVPVGARPAPSRHDSNRDRRAELMEERGSERRSSRHTSRHDDTRGDRDHRGERESRDGRDDKQAAGDSARKDDRPARREQYSQEGSDRRGGYARSGPPRDDQQSSRKHGRSEEAPSHGGGPGQGMGGRGGARIASESKRPRRGP